MNINNGKLNRIDSINPSRKSQFIVKFSFGVILFGLGLGLLLSYISIQKVEIDQQPLGPLTIDISNLKEGGIDYYLWDNMSIGVYKRTKEEISYLTSTKYMVFDYLSEHQKPKTWLGSVLDKIRNMNLDSKWMVSNYRSIKKEIFVFIMRSPIRKCNVVIALNKKYGRKGAPLYGFDKYFLDPCSKQHFDLAGRIFKNNYYTTHLLIPNHRYIDENTIEFIPNFY